MFPVLLKGKIVLLQFNNTSFEIKDLIYFNDRRSLNVAIMHFLFRNKDVEALSAESLNWVVGIEGPDEVIPYIDMGLTCQIEWDMIMP